jgi:hypothetical protein
MADREWGDDWGEDEDAEFHEASEDWGEGEGAGDEGAVTISSGEAAGSDDVEIVDDGNSGGPAGVAAEVVEKHQTTVTSFFSHRANLSAPRRQEQDGGGEGGRGRYEGCQGRQEGRQEDVEWPAQRRGGGRVCPATGEMRGGWEMALTACT